MHKKSNFRKGVAQSGIVSRYTLADMDGMNFEGMLRLIKVICQGFCPTGTCKECDVLRLNNKTMDILKWIQI